MAIKINIGKIFSTIVWGCISAGVLVLLVAAIRYRNNNTCRGYLINLTGSCISKKDITDLISPAGAPAIRSRAIQSFDLRRLETMLERNVWVQNTRLFFDNNNVLHVDVRERVPVIRVFTGDGKSFYLDSAGIKLPLLQRDPVRLPVFTGFPAGKAGRGDSARREADSVLTAGILQIGAFISRDTLWMERIAQVNINPDHSFELEPEAGDERIAFGDGSDVAEKFHRLGLFYTQVLSKVGTERYDRIDVSYAGQVVATRKGSGQRRADSLQALENIRLLIRSAQQMQPDTLRQQSVRPLETNTMTEQSLSTHDLLPATADSPKHVNQNHR
ncbi:MAG TPA: hypothetical protein VN616_04225 [Puia sp.]|nr:hypothetical protein [Puia sp.]